MPRALRVRAAAHPALAALAITAAWHLVLVGTAESLPPLAPHWFPDLGAVVVNAVSALVPLAVLWRWNGWTEAGVSRWRPRRPLLLVPLLLLALAAGSSGLSGSARIWVSSIALFLAVGINEELMSRGAVQWVAAPLGEWRAALTVASLFGIGHLQNWVFFGAELGDTIEQVFAAGTYGWCLVALRFRTGSIWPLALLHGLDDLLQIRSPGPTPIWLQVAHFALAIGYGWWLLTAGKTDRTKATTPRVLDDRHPV